MNGSDEEQKHQRDRDGMAAQQVHSQILRMSCRGKLVDDGSGRDDR